MIRIVKMVFRPDEVDSFLAIFESVKDKIAGFEGCDGVELLRDKHNSNVMFTYSYWDSEKNLDKYRYSELFADTWQKTKKLFLQKAEAWSLEKHS